MSIRFIIPLLGSIPILLACNKQPDTCYIQKDFKQWTVFEPGTYWVYLNERSLKVDCCHIDAEPLHGFTPPEPTSQQYEIIDISVSGGWLVKLYSQSLCENSYLTVGDFQYGAEALSLYVCKGIIDYISPTTFLIEKFDSFPLNDHVFVDVIHTRDSNTYADGWVRHYYLAKNIGILKFSLKTKDIDSSWSLVRWHVIQ